MSATLLSQKRNIRVQVSAAFVAMTIMIILPLLVHLIPPIGRIPLGAFLLPIFFAPLAAAFLCHPLVSIFAGFVAPYINYLTTGQPALPVAAGLSVELVVFSSMLLYFNQRKVSGSWVVPMVFLFAKLSSAIVGAVLVGEFSLVSWLSGLAYALPGLLVLMLMYTWLVRQVKSNDEQG